MAPYSPYILLNPSLFLPESDAVFWLGRIIKDIEAPYDYYTPKDPSEYVAESKMDDKAENVVLMSSGARGITVKGQVSDYVHMQVEDSTSLRSTIHASELRTIRLHSLDEIFPSMLANPVVQNKLKSWSGFFKPRASWWIVGLLLGKDITLDQEATTTSITSAGVTAPISAAFGLPVSADPGLTASHQDKRAPTSKRTFKGWRIFALQCYGIRPHIVTRAFRVGVGPRVEGGRTFQGGAEKEDHEEVAAEELRFHLDEDPWADILMDWEDEQDGIAVDED